MKGWFAIGLSTNIVVILYVAAAMARATGLVARSIADYTALGIPVDGDLGQRGLAVGVVIILIAIVLAWSSSWNLSHGRPRGFLIQAPLWLVVMPAAYAFPPAGTAVLLNLCWFGFAVSVALFVLARVHPGGRPSRDKRATPI